MCVENNYLLQVTQYLMTTLNTTTKWQQLSKKEKLDFKLDTGYFLNCRYDQILDVHFFNIFKHNKDIAKFQSITNIIYSNF